MQLWGIAAVMLSSVSMPAMAGDLLEDAGSWLQIVGEGSLKAVDPKLEKSRIWLEGQSRFDDWNHWNQGVVRAALGYSLSDRATIWAGYTWLPTQNVGKSYVSQQDVWPAFRYVLPTRIGTFTFRTMVESNFIKGNDVRVRPRQMLRVMHPLEFEPRLSLIAWDEFLSGSTQPSSAASPVSTRIARLRALAGVLIKTSGPKRVTLTSIWMMLIISTTPCTIC
jgi:hypothetical protein